MINVTRKIILVVMDSILVNIAFLLALLFRFDWIVPNDYLKEFLHVAVFLTVIKIAIYYAFGLYKSLWRYASVDEMIKILAAVSTGAMASITCSVIFEFGFPKTVQIISWMITLILIGGSRMGYRIIRKLRNYFKEENRGATKVLIIGAGEAGAMVIRELKNNTDNKYKPVAILDENPWKWNSRIHGIPVKGGMELLSEVCNMEKIDEIIIAIPSAGKRKISSILKQCQTTKCKLKTLPGLYEIIDNRVTIKNIRDVSIEDLLGREESKLNTNEIAGYLEDETVLITGGGGSIGSELCRQIARFRPKKILILDIYENSAHELQNELLHKFRNTEIQVLIASIRDMARMREIFEIYRPNVVFHAAAHKHVHLMETNASEAIKNNVVGTLNVARCADEYKCKRFVLISTDKAVNPTNIMGATKRVAEMIIQSLNKISNTEFVAVRFGNVLGSNGSVVPIFKKQIASGGPVTVTHPDVTRYFMTIPEASRLVIQAGAMAKGGEIFVLDMGEPVKIVDMAKDLIRLMGFEPDEDIKIEFIGLKPGEKLYEELLLKEEGIESTKQEGIFVLQPYDIKFNEVLMWVKKLENSMRSVKELKESLSSIVPTYRFENDENEENVV